MKVLLVRHAIAVDRDAPGLARRIHRAEDRGGAGEHQGDTAMPTGSRSGMLTDNQHGHGHDKQAVQ